MTNIKPLRRFAEEVDDFVESKENPDEWYALLGQKVTEYSVWADEELSEDYEAMQEEMPPEDRDANPNVDGFFQVGAGGWLSDGFDFDEDDSGFVYQFSYGDKVDGRLLDILVVHESVLSEKALSVVGDDQEPAKAD